MRHFNYVLTPTRINNAKPKEKPYKLVDGGGLFILVSPGGAKNWKYQYPLGGKRREVTIGRYPEISVADARDRHADYRAMVERGSDPAAHRREEKMERAARDTLGTDDSLFKVFSLKWIDERLAGKTASYRKQIQSRLDRFVWPAIGGKTLEDVKPAHVLAIIERLRATPNTAEGGRTMPGAPRLSYARVELPKVRVASCWRISSQYLTAKGCCASPWWTCWPHSAKMTRRLGRLGIGVRR